MELEPLNKKSDNKIRNTLMGRVRDLIIIGSGPAGLTAGIYAGRSNLDTLLLAGPEPGGQLTTTTIVENFPGFPDGVEGTELMKNMQDQTEKFGVEIKNETVENIDIKDKIKLIETDKGNYEAKALIFATGTSRNRLNIRGEKEFEGRGLSTCAVCDAPLFKEKTVAVLGAGDTAMEEALQLSEYADKIYIVFDKPLRASEIMKDRAKNNPKIEFVPDTEITEIRGDTKIKSISLKSITNNQEFELEVDGVFNAVGRSPNTSYLADQIELDEKGYVKTIDGTKTSSEGVFVGGDVGDPEYRQAVVAAGYGAQAAIDAAKYVRNLN